MNKIGIFYGTETGMTEAMAQVMYRVLGDDIASEPVNVNQAKVSELLQYKALILGAPSYGVGELPGRTTGSQDGNWEEFLFRLDDSDLSGKRVALFGLGNQQKYYDRFASSLIHLYQHFVAYGAEVIGAWNTGNAVHSKHTGKSNEIVFNSRLLFDRHPYFNGRARTGFRSASRESIDWGSKYAGLSCDESESHHPDAGAQRRHCTD